MRSTGISVIGDTPWGTHFCQFYQSKQDLLDILVPYFKAGLENNEYCMWITSEPLLAEEAKNALKQSLNNLDEYFERGQIEILDYTQWYTKSGKFDANSVLKGWIERKEKALQNGFDGLRLTGNTFWLKESDWKSFSEYESTINSVVSKHHMIALCTYSLEKCGAFELIDVVSNHQFSLLKQSGTWTRIESKEQKATEASLQKREALLQVTLDSIGDAVITTDNQGIVTFLNPMAEQLTGYKSEDAIGYELDNCFKIIHENTRAVIENPATKVLHGNQSPEKGNNTILISKNGQEISIDDCATPIKDAIDNILGVVIVFHDVTERRQMQKELQETRDYLDNLLNHANAPIIVWNPSFKITRFNHAFEYLTGMRSEEVLGKKLDILFPSDTRATSLDYIRRTQTGERWEAVEIPIQSVDGKIHTVLWNSATLFTADGKTAIATIAQGQDITTRKQAEEALKASESRMRRLFDSDVIGILERDDEGRIYDANDAFLNIIGYSKENLRSGKLSGLNLASSEFISADQTGITEAKQRGSCKPYEKEYIHKNGNRVPIYIGYVLLPGIPPKYLGFVIDLTQQKELELQLQKSNQKLERANRAKDEFVAMLSHELRTPLTSILGWIKLLRSHQLNAEQQKQGLEIIERNTKTQTKLIEDLLEISRMITGKLVLNIENVELQSIVEMAVQTISPTAQAKNIQLNLKLETTELIRGDSNRLQQIIFNLLSNAIKFTPKEGKVDIHLKRVDSNAVIIVKDNGIGIEPGFLSHVFNRFEQADTSTTRQFRGLGLGLAIVRHLVELHGGSVRAESPGKGQGSAFYVTLPLVAIMEDANKKTQLLSAAKNIDSYKSNDYRLKGLRVLVVEDEPDSRDLLTMILQEHGAETHGVASYEEALEQFEQFNPNLLLSDIGLPDHDGYDLIREIRKKSSQYNSQIPAIALTAYVTSEDRIRVLSSGYQAHLAKPVEPDELVAVIANWANYSASAAKLP